MKCLNPKPCEVKKPDGSCGASIVGYCPHQDKPVEPVPEPQKARCPDCEQAMGSQDRWIEQTKIAERAGHMGNGDTA